MTHTGVVLAGSRPGRDAFAEQYGAPTKALIPISGEPMVLRPVRALLQSRRIGSILVLAQTPEQIAAVLPDDHDIAVRMSSGTIASTMLDLCEDPATQWPLLVTTADHALLDAATVDEFCDRAEGQDVAVGIVERRSLLKRLPQTKRTWLTFRGGAYTGANLFALRSPDAAPVIQMWRSVEQDRKKARRIVALLGPAVLIGVALKLLSLDQVLNRLGRKFDLRIGAIPLSNPLAGVDVDKPNDHALAEAIIEGRA